MALQIFKPYGKRRNMAYRWILFALLAGIMALVLLAAEYDAELVILAAILFLFFGYFRTEPLGIAVDPQQHLLFYTYRNGWGQKKKKVVDLTTAGGHYAYEQFGKYTSGWRLLLYNRNYFRNRISIKENPKTGFDKAQLDEIVKWVKYCRER